MLPFDLSAEVNLLGRAPVVVTESGVELPNDGAPRVALRGNLFFPTSTALILPMIEVHTGLWHRDYDTGTPYDATVLDIGAEGGFRIVPFATMEAAGRPWLVHPLLELGVGLDARTLLHPWWRDEVYWATTGSVSVGAALGRSGDVWLVRVRYDNALGSRAAGTLDTAASDMGWSFDGNGGRLAVSVGYGWR